MKPRIDSVTPNRGHTGGKTVVEIVGAGFREPADAPATGPVPAPAPTVRVLFGGTPATDVAVFGEDLLNCRSPIHDPGTVDVVVQNLGELRAELVTADVEPFAVSVGQQVQIAVNGSAQAITLLAGEVAIAGQATAAEVSALLNRLDAVQATVVGGKVRLRTDRRGPTSALAITGGTAAPGLGFPGDPATGSTALEVIDGEEATAPTAFTFARPDLGKKLPPTLALEQLIIELRRQVLDNVQFATHTDYDPETGDLLNVAQLASLPAIVLAGLDIVDDTDRRVLGVREVKGSTSDRAVTKAPQDIVDLTMSVIAVTDNPVEAINLHTILRVFFRKNGKLIAPVLDGVPVDPTNDDTFAEYQTQWRQGVPAGVSVQGGNDNLITITGALIILGIPTGQMPLDEGALPAGAQPGQPHEGTTSLTWTNETTELGTEPKT